VKNFMHPKVSGELFDALMLRVRRLREDAAQLDAVGCGSEWHRAQHRIAQHWAAPSTTWPPGPINCCESAALFCHSDNEEANTCCGPF